MRPPAFRTLLWGVLLALAAAFAVHRATALRPQWAYDGYAYSIAAQVDRGTSYTAARAASRAVYRIKPAMQRPAAQRWLAAPHPQWWRLFASRPFYPWLSSLLWPHFGFGALFVVSNLAYVASALLLYAVLLAFARPPLAVLIAAAVVAMPEALRMGRSDLTDATALALWCAALLAMLRYTRDGDRRWLLGYALAVAVASLTRPLAQMPFCAAAGVVLYGLRYADRGTLSRGAALAAIALADGVLLVAIAAHTRAPSFASVLAADRASSHIAAPTLASWYARSILWTGGTALAWAAQSLAAPLAIAVLFWRGRRPECWLLLGVLASGIVTVLLDPIPSDVARVVVLPALPALACGLAIGLQAVLPARRRSAGTPAATGGVAPGPAGMVGWALPANPTASGLSDAAVVTRK